MLASISRDVVLKKWCGNASEKTAILKQLKSNFKAKREKGVGKPFLRPTTSLNISCPFPSLLY